MLSNYLKTAFKVFLRRKVFTLISLFGVSLSLLVLIVASAFLDHIFGVYPPETKGDRSLGVFVMKMSGKETIHTGNPGYKFLDRYVRTLPGAEKVSIYSEVSQVTAYRNGERVALYRKRTDGEFWQILDFKFLEGGPFTPEDEKNANSVAVINEATKNRFFGDGPAVGRTLELDAQRFRVVGVVPNVPFFRFVPFADVWVPISTAKSDAYKRELVGSFNATILARDRHDLPAIQREFQAVLPRVELPPGKVYDRIEGGAETLFESFARGFFDFQIEDGRAAALLALLLGAGVLFLVLPAVNLVNLNVSRIMERASEIGVRKAFGASRRTLVGQFVVENVVLCLLGGALGFVLSFVVLAIVSASGVVPYAEFHVNHRIFLYGLAAASFFGVFSGVLPAWRMARLHPAEALRGRAR